MLRTSLFLIVVLVVGCVPASVGSQDNSAGKTSTYVPFLPGTEPPNTLSVRVMRWEGATPMPVEGARVTGWSEESGDDELPTARLLAEGHSDKHGFVNVSWESVDGGPFHWLVEAPGMAVRAFDPDGDVFLVPGASYALRVLAPMGDPLKRARVQYYIYGCPHSPSARTGTTDDEGRVVLDGLPDLAHPNPDARNEWGQFWIMADGVAPGPYNKPAGGTLLTRHGKTAQGVVRGDDAKPKPGIVVRAVGYPRGPVMRTDALGRFRLSGLSDGQDIAVYDPRDPLPSGPNAIIRDFEPDVPIRVTLEPGRAASLGEGQQREIVEVAVLRRSSPEAQPAPEDGVPVRLVRLTDGLVAAGTTGNQGLFRTTLPPGRYRVLVGGGFSSVVRAERELDVPTAEPERFVLDAASSLVLRGRDASAPEQVELILPSGSESATQTLPGVLHLPPDGPAVIRVERGRPVLRTVGPTRDGVRTATVPAAHPVVIRGRLTSAGEGRPVEFGEAEWADEHVGREAEPESSGDGRWTVRTHRRGRHSLTVRSLEEFQDRTIEIAISPDAREVDLGDVVLHPLRSRSVRVVNAEGAVVHDVRLHWGLHGRRGSELPQHDGSFPLSLGAAVTPAVLRGDGIYPHPLRLTDGGPAEVRLPGGRVVVRVRDSHGRSLAAVVYVDHVEVPLAGQEHALGAIPAGSHTLIVGARGHVGAVRTIRLDEDEARTIEFTLTPR